MFLKNVLFGKRDFIADAFESLLSDSFVSGFLLEKC